MAASDQAKCSTGAGVAARHGADQGAKHLQKKASERYKGAKMAKTPPARANGLEKNGQGTHLAIVFDVVCATVRGPPRPVRTHTGPLALPAAVDQLSLVHAMHLASRHVHQHAAAVRQPVTIDRPAIDGGAVPAGDLPALDLCGLEEEEEEEKKEEEEERRDSARCRGRHRRFLPSLRVWAWC